MTDMQEYNRKLEKAAADDAAIKAGSVERMLRKPEQSEVEILRDKIARLEAECAALNKLLSEAMPALSFAADLIRQIQSTMQAGEKL